MGALFRSNTSRDAGRVSAEWAFWFGHARVRSARMARTVRPSLNFLRRFIRVKAQVLTVTLVIATLAACGGGGSSSSGGGVIAPPTTTPTSYVAFLEFHGQMTGNVQDAVRRAYSHRLDSGTATPLPILITAPIENGCVAGYCVNTGNNYVQAIVSPKPTGTPATTFANTAPDVTIAPTTVPSAAPTGVVAEAQVENSGADNVQTSGTASATIGSPVDQTASLSVYQYRAIGLECNTNGDANYSPGWAWNGTAWVTASSPATSDVYLTGASCDGNFAVAGDPGTLHFPGGGSLISTDTYFSTIAASSWTNTQTSATLAQIGSANPDGSFTAILLAKTATGAIFKMFPNEIAQGIYAGGVEVAGAGVDGF